MIKRIKNYFKDMFVFKRVTVAQGAKKKRKERIRLTEELKHDILSMYSGNTDKSDGYHLSYSDIGLLNNVSASSVGKVIRESKDK